MQLQKVSMRSQKQIKCKAQSIKEAERSLAGLNFEGSKYLTLAKRQKERSKNPITRKEDPYPIRIDNDAQNNDKSNEIQPKHKIPDDGDHRACKQGPQQRFLILKTSIYKNFTSFTGVVYVQNKKLLQLCQDCYFEIIVFSIQNSKREDVPKFSRSWLIIAK